jgi:hypothetical protein
MPLYQWHTHMRNECVCGMWIITLKDWGAFQETAVMTVFSFSSRGLGKWTLSAHMHTM